MGTKPGYYYVESTRCSVHEHSLPNSQVERFGRPTRRRLVEAIENHTGGNNPALAYEIARKYPCVYSNHKAS